MELIEERKRAKQDQLAKAVAEAATAAAKRKKENEATVVTVTEKTDEVKEAQKNTELALCFTEPLSGVWHVPLSSDGWRWKEGGIFEKAHFNLEAEILYKNVKSYHYVRNEDC